MNQPADSLRSSDGTRLYIEHFGEPTHDGARGTVLIVHGLGEHVGRYAHVATWLRERGFAVVGYDHRGHGKSDGARGVIQDPSVLYDDLALAVDALRPSQGPLLLLGHSMGGALVARFVAQHRRSVDFVILSSPALRARMTAFQRLQLALGLRLMPTLALPNGLDVNAIARNRETVAAYVNDPLVHNRICAQLAKVILDAGAEALASADEWGVPTLLLYSGADRLVDPAGSDAFAASAPVEVVESERFDALYHEILNEGALAAPVFARVERWLDARLPR